jgi:Domain of unknown function (DUF5666)
MMAGSSTSESPKSFLIILTLLLSIAISTGCGSGGGMETKQQFSGNTSVTVLVDSTANDQVTRFELALQTLTLTGQSGNAVSLLSTQQPAEFMHLNGGIEPLVTVSVPQGIYTSAAATLAGAVFVCIAQVPGGGLGISNYSVVNQGPAVTLPSPITVTGDSMAFLLNMNVSASAAIPACWTDPPFEGFSMMPSFDLTPLAISSSPTNSLNGKVSGLAAMIASVGASSLTVTIAGGGFGTRSLTLGWDQSTVFQGVGGASALSPGMFLNLDGAVEPDGSLLATRIAVEDSSAINDSSGPVIFVENEAPVLQLYGRTELGALQTFNGQSGIYFDLPSFGFDSSTFQISGQLANLGSLPFLPSFNASNIVAGQNVDITSGNFSTVGGVYPPANTITLVPQTINGTVTASQASGSFVDYTISLASYDLFPNLASQPGQSTLLTNPGQIEVYVDSSTQTLNTQPLSVGSTLRFYGLVFDDSGTLRMDCAQVTDGVPETSPTGSAARVPPSTQEIQQGRDGLVLRKRTTTD